MDRWVLVLLSAAIALSGVRANDASATAKALDALDEARRLAAAGDHAGALEKHLQFHRHILEVDPAMAGVRLSFALLAWKNLGASYPPALTALRKVRDEDVALLLSEKRTAQLFQDVAAINGELALDDGPATVALFKQLDSTAPVFAKKVYRYAEKDLVTAREFTLARKHLGDVDQCLAEARQIYEMLVNSGRNQGARGSAAENLFTGRALSIIKILEGVGDHAGARAVQVKALAVVSNDAIRQAVGK